ncbi:MAG: hypothetical protein ACHQNV_03775 [Vicinamibacteria bacterium]
MPVLAIAGCVSAALTALAFAEAPDLPRLQKMTARFAPVEIGADTSKLPENERRTLAKVVEAARLMDPLFLRQSSAANEARLVELVRDETPMGKARLHYFLVNQGPWDRLEHDAPFIPGVEAKAESGNFYPAGATREEMDQWMKALTGAEKESATGFFTTIRRGADGRFAVVPYSLEYQGELARASALLREAAALTAQPSLRAFLEKRAAAFLSNDYYDSDVAWMELDASIEPTIGPYEVYEDGWFNFKAAFEAFVTLRDDAETAKLGRFSAELQELEDHLPIDPGFRRKALGGLSPIRVVNVVYAGGDGNRGVQTAAYNLPNDERVVEKMGSKRVMLKNVQEAKFQKALVPISKVALAASEQPLLSFDAFFTHILMHELMHGLGPQTIRVAGRATTVRQELKEANGPLEEAKADISGLWALQYLMDKGVLDKKLERSMYTTFLASGFRSVRFGLGEAHGKAMAIQMNSLVDAGAFRASPDGTFAVDLAKAKAGAAALTAEIMTIQANGDYAKAKEMIARRATIRPEVQKVLDRLNDVPVDIEPRFTTAAQLTPR